MTGTTYLQMSEYWWVKSQSVLDLFLQQLA